jgi:hypothetical protein
VKAKETMPIMPEIRKKGEVVAVVDTTTPMAGWDSRYTRARGRRCCRQPQSRYCHDCWVGKKHSLVLHVRIMSGRSKQ